MLWHPFQSVSAVLVRNLPGSRVGEVVKACKLSGFGLIRVSRIRTGAQVVGERSGPTRTGSKESKAMSESVAREYAVVVPKWVVGVVSAFSVLLAGTFFTWSFSWASNISGSMQEVKTNQAVIKHRLESNLPFQKRFEEHLGDTGLHQFLRGRVLGLEDRVQRLERKTDTGD